jgi:hypothetical protein
MIKVLNASNGIVTEPRSEMYDAGIAKYSAFVFDDKSEKYKQVMIKQTGDWFIDNKSPEANEIYNWMVKLNQ